MTPRKKQTKDSDDIRPFPPDADAGGFTDRLVLELKERKKERLGVARSDDRVESGLRVGYRMIMTVTVTSGCDLTLKDESSASAGPQPSSSFSPPVSRVCET